MMNIRAYTPLDRAAIVGIYNASKLDELVRETQAFTLIPLEDDRQRQAALFAAKIFVVEMGSINASEVVGYIAVSNDELVGFNVLPSYRGKGLGKQLLNYALALLQEDVWLQVVNSNSPTRCLYESAGFEKVEDYIVNYNGKAVLVDKMVLSRRNTG